MCLRIRNSTNYTIPPSPIVPCWIKLLHNKKSKESVEIIAEYQYGTTFTRKKQNLHEGTSINYVTQKSRLSSTPSPMSRITPPFDMWLQWACHTGLLDSHPSAVT